MVLPSLVGLSGARGKTLTHGLWMWSGDRQLLHRKEVYGIYR